MAKKVVKKKKLKIIPFLIVLLVIGGLSFGLYKTMTAKIKNIIIKLSSFDEVEFFGNNKVRVGSGSILIKFFLLIAKIGLAVFLF